MPLTPQDVSHKVFGPTRLRRGYNENEVDAFLDLVEAELTRLTEENASLRAELEHARAQQPGAVVGAVVGTGPSTGPSTGRTSQVGPSASREVAVQEPVTPSEVERITRTLVLAQRTADQALQEARQEAEVIRTAAQREAQDKLSKAERVKARLDGEVDSLRTFEREYRSRLRAYLQVQLKELESDTGESVAAVDITDVDGLDGPPMSPPVSPPVSLLRTDESAGAPGPPGSPPASVRLPSDIENVPSSLFQPPVLVGVNNGSGGVSNGAGSTLHGAGTSHGAAGMTHAAAAEQPQGT